uniref:Uncharacterized protein n=1 Tax=Timema poppense TaxID=170557 RepID=A0A7R9H9M3_TIMPO|nr:unnamed protein product [Timema poppensis]
MTSLMNKHSKRWTYNRKRLQAISSGVCGHYCCLYAVAKTARWILRRFTGLFSTINLYKNDQLAVTLFNCHFGSCPRCTRRGAQPCVSALDIKVLVNAIPVFDDDDDDDDDDADVDPCMPYG